MQNLQIGTVFEALLLALLEARLRPEPQALMAFSELRSAPGKPWPDAVQATGLRPSSPTNAAALRHGANEQLPP